MSRSSEEAFLPAGELSVRMDAAELHQEEELLAGVIHLDTSLTDRPFFRWGAN